MLWKPAKYLGKDAWREDQGHYLVRHEEHWELVHPKKDGILGFFSLRADGEPPLPAANKRLGEKPCYGTGPTLRSVTEQPAVSSVSHALVVQTVSNPKMPTPTESVTTHLETTDPVSSCMTKTDEPSPSTDSMSG